MTKNFMTTITVGVLALQGAFHEHIQLLKEAVANQGQWEFIEVRTPPELARCDALILPGGESTAISLVAARSNMLESLRDFVKYFIRAAAPIHSSVALTFQGSIANPRGEHAPVSFYLPNRPTGQNKADRTSLEVSTYA